MAWYDSGFGRGLNRKVAADTVVLVGKTSNTWCTWQNLASNLPEHRRNGAPGRETSSQMTKEGEGRQGVLTMGPRTSGNGQRWPRDGGVGQPTFGDIARRRLPAELRAIDFNGGDVAWGAPVRGRTAQARSGRSAQRRGAVVGGGAHRGGCSRLQSAGETSGKASGVSCTHAGPVKREKMRRGAERSHGGSPCRREKRRKGKKERALGGAL
jgi:hypothetical protein